MTSSHVWPAAAALHDPRLRRAGGLLGFAMGGFFDGILLHQILQWHHLLSGVSAGMFSSLRFQITMDGIFHALMYVIAALGLWQLHRARTVGTPTGTPWPAFWIGFGAWHVIDALVSHWITGIHRVRMDSDVPLAWDLLWLVVFGLAPIWLGWRLARRSRGGPPGGSASDGNGGLDARAGTTPRPRSSSGGAARADGGPRMTFMPLQMLPLRPVPPPLGRRSIAIVMLALLTLAAAGLNLFPPRQDLDTTVVTLRPGQGPAALIARLPEGDGRVLWSDPAGEVWVLTGLGLADRLSLYGAGALYVSGATLPGGCSRWLSADVASGKARSARAPT